MDLAEMRILVVVGIKCGEIPHDRKSKGSMAIQISHGLVNPNFRPSWLMRERETG